MATTKYIWDEDDFLAETDATDAVQIIYTNEPEAQDGLVSQHGASSTAYFHFDAVGSARQLTNQSAAVTDSRLFGSWGNSVTSTGSIANSVGWVAAMGYREDFDLGNTHVRRRQYQQETGRWTSKFTSETSSKPSNYYYCMNSPIHFADPAGLDVGVIDAPPIRRRPPGWKPEIPDPVIRPPQLRPITPSPAPQPFPSLVRPATCAAVGTFTIVVLWPKEMGKGDYYPPNDPPPPLQKPGCRERNKVWPPCKGETSAVAVAKSFLRDSGLVPKITIRGCFRITFDPIPCPNGQGGRGGFQVHCTTKIGRLDLENEISVACCNCCNALDRESYECIRPHWSDRYGGTP